MKIAERVSKLVSLIIARGAENTLTKRRIARSRKRADMFERSFATNVFDFHSNLYQASLGGKNDSNDPAAEHMRLSGRVSHAPPIVFHKKMMPHRIKAISFALRFR